MTCNNEIHENDVGTEFIVTIVECINDVFVPVDISSATLMQITFVRTSDGSKMVKTAAFTSIASGGAGDGTDGNISYFSLITDLTPVGTYKIQGIVTTPAGSWSSVIDKFKVLANL